MHRALGAPLSAQAHALVLLASLALTAATLPPCIGMFGAAGVGPNGAIQQCVITPGRYDISVAGAQGGHGYWYAVSGGLGAKIDVVADVTTTEVL